MEKLEELYYEDMQNARLTDATSKGHQCDKDALTEYPADLFFHSVRRLDVYTLDTRSANFAKHEEIVKDFSVYRRTVAQELSKTFRYDGVRVPGQLKDIGSCWDGSKVGEVNEMDSLYVMDHPDFLVTESGNGCYRVYLGKDTAECEITPRKLRNQFTYIYNSLISETKLPTCLEHGGFNSSENVDASCTDEAQVCTGETPTCKDEIMFCKDESPSRRTIKGPPSSCYSGVRYNGPAVTSQFLTKNKSLLTWDITPVLLLPAAGRLEEIIRNVIMPIIAENPGKMFPYIDIHLFPDATDNVWRLSTAHMEASILRDLSREAPVKKALAICKVIFSWLQDWNRKNAAPSSSINEQAALDITKELEQFIALENGMEKEELRQQLIANMRYAHIWMPSNKRSCYCEAGKSNISVNTAAVKHIVIKAGLERHGSFSPKENLKLLLELIREVFKQLGRENIFTTDHAFLPGTRISHFSLLACVANNKQSMAKQIRQQCRIIHSEVMTEVRIVKFG